MKISQMFHLPTLLPFIDVDLSTDTELFINPLLIRVNKKKFYKEMDHKIVSFRKKTINMIEHGSLDDLLKLWDNTHEKNYTHLGYSDGKSAGKACGKETITAIYEDHLVRSLISQNKIKGIEDTLILVDNINKDKISDIITNIILKELVVFTQYQCKLFGITNLVSKKIGKYWNGSRWISLNDFVPLDKTGKPILFVPNEIVTNKERWSANRYYSMQICEENQTKLEKKYTTTSWANREKGLSKKEVKTILPYSIDYVRGYVNEKPSSLQKFKDRVSIELRLLLSSGKNI
ncbi:MAG: hypothetical protein WC010_02610 [Candidatus Absconditabacterales bacterium]